MVNYSFSTMLMTFITSNLIIVLITMCFRHEKILLSIGYKLAAVFLVLTILRVLFPFELPFARNIYLPTALSAVIVLIRHVFFELWGIPISIWTIFEVVWATGFVVKLYRQYKENKSFHRFLHIFGQDVTEEEPYRSVLATVCGKRRNHFRLLRVPSLQSPVLVGICKPCILLPKEQELTLSELYFTFRHETYHHYKRDLITKYGLNLLCMFYWWNPACAKMQKQMHQVLEMRIDDNVAEKNSHTAVAYLSAMVNIMEALQSDDPDHNPVPANFSASLTKEQSNEMERRFHMLCGRDRTRWPLFWALFALMMAIYVGSYLVIVEAHYEYSGHTQDTIPAYEDLYATPNANGTYDIYYGDIFIESTDTLEYYPSDIPIRQE